MDVIRAVFLDVGETIVDESREYGAWADWLGVPRHTFSAVLGAVIASVVTTAPLLPRRQASNLANGSVFRTSSRVSPARRAWNTP